MADDPNLGVILHGEVAENAARSFRPAEVAVYHPQLFGIGPDIEFRTLRDCSFPQDTEWNDTITKIVVISGTWEFFVDAHFQGQSVILGPGYYLTDAAIGLPPRSISSLRLVALDPV